MGEGNLEEFDLVLAGEDALRPAVERDRAQMIDASPLGLREVFRMRTSPSGGEGQDSATSPDWRPAVSDSTGCGSAVTADIPSSIKVDANVDMRMQKS